MPAPWRRRLRLARRGLWYASAAVLVAMALVAGAVSQLLPLAERHPGRIAAWLGDRAGRPVAFDGVRTRWTRRGPLLQLDGLRIGEGAQAIAIGDAEMLVAQYSGLLPGGSFTELRLRGLDLTLERDRSGRWHLRGLPGQQLPGGDPLAALQGLGELQVIGGKLAIVAPDLEIDTRLPRVDLRMRVDRDRVRAGVRARMRADAPPLDAVLDFDRRRGDGKGWLLAKQADLAAWSPLLQLAGVRAVAGHGRAEGWLALRDHRVVAVTAQLALEDLALAGKPLRPAQPAPRVAFRRVEGLARWRAVEGGWRVDAPRLRLGVGGRVQALDGLLVAGGRRYGIVAERLDAAPLLAVAALSDRLTPGLRSWVLAARPQALLEQVTLVGTRAGRRGGTLRARARITGAGLLPVGNAPGVQGLAGELHGDAEGFALRLDPRADVRVDWPRGFGVGHRVRLAGSVAGWRDGAGWRAGTSALRMAGDGFSAGLRGGLWFQGDGTRPRIDLAVALGDVPVATAKTFLVRNRMPPAAVAWLDRALVAGVLQEGRALVSGDLDDWPFRDPVGRFEASAWIRNGTLKFNPDWPAAEHVDAQVGFLGDGFEIAGRGSIAGVGIRGFRGGIEHFGNATLKVAAEGGGDAAQLLALLRQSPLRKLHAEILDNLAASGPAVVAFSLEQPLRRGAPPPTLGGTVVLAGARLSEKRWKLAFDNVRGRASYGNGGFEARGLEVRHEGQAGRLSLRAGDQARDRRHAFEAELDAALAADALLDRAPDLAWLKPHVEGVSPWTIAVAIPRSSQAGSSQARSVPGRSAQARSAPGRSAQERTAQARAGQAPGPSRLQLRSTLVGTALTLPAPLDKPARTALPTTVEVDLPIGQGEVAVAFGNRLALRSRRANGRTGIRVALGSSRVAEPPPASGLVASGRADVLDAIGWAALTRGGGDDKQGGLELRGIDVQAARLRLVGSDFADTRVRAVPVAGGTAVQLDGAALAGALLLPRSATEPLAGKLQRLHWRAAQTAAASDAPAAADDVDPAKLPPLNLAVDDLRFGDAPLGSASLRTQPVAGGMRIVQLQTRAPAQRIDIQGDWLGRGAAARTRLEVQLNSDDFGALLRGFGFGGQVSGGKGSARLAASWPGGPASFRLPALQGTLEIAARDGQLTEIEPGAGRVLGLLSIAQLPRRLTLDFRDFFARGFAFNRIEGGIRFGNAVARSDNLVIEGPAAEIRIRGAANLRAQTYDQTIDVFPRAGNLLTVAGAIAGGPIGAAIGAAANAVLKKPLGQMAAKTYRVTGPWKQPRVEVIGRQQGRAATPPATGSG